MSERDDVERTKTTSDDKPEGFDTSARAERPSLSAGDSASRSEMHAGDGHESHGDRPELGRAEGRGMPGSGGERYQGERQVLPDVSGRHDGSGPDGRPSLARPGGENLVQPEPLPLHKPDDPVHVELLSQQGKPGGSDAAKASGGREEQEKPGPDGRTDSQIRNELEKRTDKAFDQLILGLGRGPTDPGKISPRELEMEMENNGTLRHLEMDTKEPVVIDEVLKSHPTQENRFVTEGRTGPESKITAEKVAGQQAGRDAFISGVTMGLAGNGSASEGLVKPAPEVRRYEPRPPTTYEPRSEPYKPEPSAHGGLDPQILESNSQLKDAPGDHLQDGVARLDDPPARLNVSLDRPEPKNLGATKDEASKDKAAKGDANPDPQQPDAAKPAGPSKNGTVVEPVKGVDEKNVPKDHAGNPKHPLPHTRDNPQRGLAENPGTRANWEAAVEKVFEKGSYEKNINEFRGQLQERPHGKVSTPGTAENFARESFNAVRREFYKIEAKNPSYSYTEAQRARLAVGQAPEPSRPAPGGYVEEPRTGSVTQIHHLQTIEKAPGRALDHENLSLMDGSQLGSTHHEAHHGEGARREEAWARDEAAGRRPQSQGLETKEPEIKTPETKASEVREPGMHVPGGGGRLMNALESLGRTLGVVGDIFLVKAMADDLKWLNEKERMPVGSTHTDLWGNTWTKGSDREWHTPDEKGA